MLLAILDDLRVDGKFCRIHRGYKTGWEYGFVVFADDDVVVMKLYDSDGIYDGLKIMLTEDIENVDWNGNNLNSRMKMINRHGLNIDKIEMNVDSMGAFLESAQERYGYVACCLDSEDVRYIGELIAHDDRWIHLINYGNPNNLDRTHVLFQKGAVRSLEVGSLYQENLMMLHGKTPLPKDVH